jgi:hypothetical protein
MNEDMMTKNDVCVLRKYGSECDLPIFLLLASPRRKTKDSLILLADVLTRLHIIILYLHC